MKPKGKVLGKSRELTLTPAQRDTLLANQKGRGGNNDLFRTLAERLKVVDGVIVLRIYDVDMERLERLAAREDPGTWQKWAREVLADNPKIAISAPPATP